MPFGVEKRTTLTIYGTATPSSPIPDLEAELTLALVGPGASSGNATLFLAADPAGLMPLVVIPAQLSSGNTSLYINATATSDITASGWQAYTTLAIPATSGVFHSGSFPLFLSSPSQADFPTTNTSTLFTSGDVGRVSTNTTLFVSGGTTSGPGNVDQNITLFVGTEAPSSENMPLFIEKDYNTDNSATLYINNRMGSGHLPLAMGSTYVSSDNIPLFIAPPASGQMALYTRGYLE
tara:strand:+ start:386 stop:1093 length:708 start_codon:yes stop_codon:yes gene_type:complete